MPRSRRPTQVGDSGHKEEDHQSKSAAERPTCNNRQSLAPWAGDPVESEFQWDPEQRNLQTHVYERLSVQ